MLISCIILKNHILFKYSFFPPYKVSEGGRERSEKGTKLETEAKRENFQISFDA